MLQCIYAGDISILHQALHNWSSFRASTAGYGFEILPDLVIFSKPQCYPQYGWAVVGSSFEALWNFGTHVPASNFAAGASTKCLQVGDSWAFGRHPRHRDAPADASASPQPVGTNAALAIAWAVLAASRGNPLRIALECKLTTQGRQGQLGQVQEAFDPDGQYTAALICPDTHLLENAGV